MKNKASKIDLFSLSEQLPMESIGDDFIVMDDISAVPFFDYPTKVGYAVSSICLKGRVEGAINLKPIAISENDILVVLPGQIVQYSYISDDFSGLVFVMSKRFTDNLELNFKDSIPVMFYLKENPVMHLATDEIEHLLKYYDILLRTVRMTHNTNRLEIVRLLVQALFYSLNNFQQIREISGVPKSKREGLFDVFYELVLAHYKESREVGFYAEKLCLTPKYLSTVIKEKTGKSAFDWINDYVMLEAKSLLKSTNMTIQQISGELNFANQSFFGKFFKQHAGVSPKEYRGG